MLNFKGILKTTLIDYPGEIACTLFLAGCNFRCGYCFNPALVLGESDGDIPGKDILIFLEKRRKILDGVCLTGGEPLLHFSSLLTFLKEVKALGYKIKLDTNGSFPQELQALLDEKLLDYIAMDIKGPLEKYPSIVRRSLDLKAIQESVEIIKKSEIRYEFRTTVFSGLHENDFVDIGKWLKGAEKYFLQPLRLNLGLLDDNFPKENKALSSETLKGIATSLNPYFNYVAIRP